MKTILIITVSLSEKNGVGRYSQELIQRLCKSFKLLIFSGKEDDGLEKLPNCRVFPILPHFSNFFKLRNPLVFLSCFWNILKLSRGIDLVHSFMDYPHSFLAALVALFLRRPLFLTAIGTYSIEPFKLWPDKYFHRLALKRAKKVVCISRFTERQILKRIKLDNIAVINLGVDYKKFAEFTPPFLQKRQGKEEIIIGTGMLKVRKGYHISIPAIGEVKKRYPNIKYYIVGDQSDREHFNKLKDLVKKYDLKENVVFLEKISDKELIELYYSADLFLLTPVNIRDNFEGFGLVYLEAGACGKPVIGTHDCGAEDAIVNGVTGLLVPQNDIKKTTEAVLKLLDNPDLAQKMGANGEKFTKEMDWDNVVKKYIEIYESN